MIDERSENLRPIKLSEMTPQEQFAIVMFRAGKDTAEIARLMKISEAEAEKLVHSARDKGRKS